MRVNYHTHTNRYGHGTGTEEEYVRAAIASGVEILGISEHSTYLMHPDATEEPHLSKAVLPQYISAVQESAKRHRNEVEIHYCNQIIEGMQTGAFTYVAHPDYILFFGDRKLLKQQLRRVCREAKSCDLPLEINLLGIHKNKHYTCKEFFELLAEEGNTVILGADAYQPEHIFNFDAENKAHILINEYDLKLIETTPFHHF